MINELNIDDIIRDEKRKLRNKDLRNYAIKWGNFGYEALRNFFIANMPCQHGWFCFCENGTSIKDVDRLFKEGITFMGIKHFWNHADFSKKGYKVIKV